MAIEYKVWVSVEQMIDGDSQGDIDLPLGIGTFRGPGAKARALKFVSGLPSVLEEV